MIGNAGKSKIIRTPNHDDNDTDCDIKNGDVTVEKEKNFYY